MPMLILLSLLLLLSATELKAKKVSGQKFMFLHFVSGKFAASECHKKKKNWEIIIIMFISECYIQFSLTYGWDGQMDGMRKSIESFEWQQQTHLIAPIFIYGINCQMANERKRVTHMCEVSHTYWFLSFMSEKINCLSKIFTRQIPTNL